MPAPPELDEAVARFLAEPIAAPAAPPDLTARARKRRSHRHRLIASTAAVLMMSCVAGFVYASSDRHNGLDVTARSDTSVGVTTTPPAAPIEHVSGSGSFVATVLPSGLSLLHETPLSTDPWYGTKSVSQLFSRDGKRADLVITTTHDLPMSAIEELATVDGASSGTPITIDGRPGLLTIATSVTHHPVILSWAVTDEVLVAVISYIDLPSAELQGIADGMRAPAATNATLHGELRVEGDPSSRPQPLQVYALQGNTRIAALGYVLGTFTMSLPPGTYQIATSLTDTGEPCAPQSITVGARESANVTLQCPKR